MYNLRDYGDMIADETRTDAYVEALRRAVRPGAVVVDIGTGFGFFAVIACQLGARHVYAIESNPVVRLGSDIARANGCADHITFIHNLSTHIDLPERADVILSDLRGNAPLFGQHIPAIKDARARFLAPGGMMMPQRDDLWVSLAEAPSVFELYSQPWTANKYGVDLRQCWQHESNRTLSGKVAPDQLLSEPVQWAALDYPTIDDPNVSATISAPIKRAGTAHGLRLWFETTLVDGIQYSNAPGSPVNIYNYLFLPLSEPVETAEGDVLTLFLQANLVGEDYVWRWDTTITDSAGQSKAAFKQSTFFSQRFDPAALHKRSPDYRPRLSGDGDLLRVALELMAQQMPLREMADRLLARFPERFADRQAALQLAGSLSVQYSD